MAGKASVPSPRRFTRSGVSKPFDPISALVGIARLVRHSGFFCVSASVCPLTGTDGVIVFVVAVMLLKVSVRQCFGL